MSRIYFSRGQLPDSCFVESMRSPSGPDGSSHTLWYFPSCEKKEFSGQSGFCTQETCLVSFKQRKPPAHKQGLWRFGWPRGSIDLGLRDSKWDIGWGGLPEDTSIGAGIPSLKKVTLPQVCFQPHVLWHFCDCHRGMISLDYYLLLFPHFENKAFSRQIRILHTPNTFGVSYW